MAAIQTIQRTSTLPTRPLGRTGFDATILALGGIKYNELPEAEAAAVVTRALDLGINYIDTAHTYKDSERKIGPVLAERREGIYIATKTQRRDYDGAMKEIEQSLERLRTDVIDCLQFHDLETKEEWAQITGPGGALKAAEEMRDAGKIRFLGVTGHSNPEILVHAIEDYPLETVLVTIGPVHEAVRPFYPTVAPVAKRRGTAILGMKVMATGWMAGMTAQSLRFVVGLEGVAAAVVGMDSIEQVEANVAAARDFTPLDPTEQKVLLDRAKAEFEKRPGEAWFVHPKSRAE